MRRQIATAQPIVDAEDEHVEKTISNSAAEENASKEAEEAAQDAVAADILQNVANQSVEKLDEEKQIGTVESKKLMSETGPASISHGGTSRSFATKS